MKRLTCLLSLFVCGTAVGQTAPVPKAEEKASAAAAKPAAPAAPAPTRRAARQAGRAAAQQKKKPVVLPTPTVADAAYGDHPKQRIHFWKAETTEPAPLLFFVHGGGWRGGDRTSVASLLKPMLSAGISVVSVEYRFVQEAPEVEPPVKAPLHDAARALQFVRSKAAEWNIDKTRIAASGGSAGACTSLWLAFHDDLADPNSADPVARESTRILCAAVNGAQTTLDPAQMKEWTPNSRYGAHAFKITAPADGSKSEFEAFLAKRDEIMPWIKEYSPYHNVTKDDSPVYLNYAAVPNLGQDEKDPTHSANFGVKLQEHCKEIGVDCELVYPGATDVKHPTIAAYLTAKLKK
ncbi:Carboxylesterase NlhH [Caulifigura coniformis]|uniref:Carboxylesterase NlhH n=1 Tax=Caulifigura coniformis TaxID=2527983 RepID=A0A517S7Z5_9PLAN|nr:alpha/beta hydrolase [Caulifigura coniformis]QDT52213.1 Carboxylesterase NlhH [Caulifigura coniformis]